MECKEKEKDKNRLYLIPQSFKKQANNNDHY